MRRVRGREIGMIFQEPMTSLNPVLTIGRQLTEPVEIHLGMTPAAVARPRRSSCWAGRHLRPRAAPAQYPHQFSGGMRQRMMIAMALACNPAPDPGRRAHHRARRDHPGPDPRADEGPLAPARRGHAHDHAQPRGGGPLRRSRERDVRGPHRRARHGPRALRQSAASLHARAAALGAAARRAAPRQARCPSRASPRTSSRLPAGCSFAPRCAVRDRALPRARCRRSSRSAPGHLSACWVAAELGGRRRRERGAPPATIGPARSGTERRDPRGPEPRQALPGRRRPLRRPGAAW